MLRYLQLNGQVRPLSERPLLFESLHNRLAFALFLYTVIISLLFPYAGRGVGAFAALPVALAATYYGPWRGFIAGGLSLPFNSMLYILLDSTASITSVIEPSGVVGTIAVMGLGYGVGCISNLGKRLQHEVREREEAQKALEDANMALANQAQKSAEARNYFLTAVSHELRTPLNAVLGASALLMDTSADGEQKDLIETVRKGGQDTVQIINTILDYTKTESGAMRLNHNRFDLLTCLDKVINQHIRRASEKGIEISYNVSPSVPISAFGDAQRLTYILNTLVGNALKFTDEGEISIYVGTIDHSLDGSLDDSRDNILNQSPGQSEPGIGISPTSQHRSFNPASQHLTGDQFKLSFTVQDSGVGIRPESIDGLFEPFEKAVEAASQTYHAIGLGLALCRSLCKLMNGDIWVTSDPGKGATFNFTVVLDKSWAEPTVLTSLTPHSGKYVLIVGERDSIQENIASILRRVGITVIAADSVDSAQQVISSQLAIDLVIIADKVYSEQSTRNSHFVSYVDAIQMLFHGEQPPTVLLVNTEHQEQDSMIPATCISNVLLTPLQWEKTVKAIGSTMAHNSHRKPDLGRVKWKADKVHFDEELANQMPLCILMAEDNPVNAKVAMRILERFGYQVDWVPNGLAAVEAVQNSFYDVIFMDIQMPKMDGIEATKAIRQLDAPFRQPHIIALTADTTLEDHAKYKAMGLDDYTGKPISVDVLRNALERAWRTRSKAEKAEKAANRDREGNPAHVSEPVHI